MALIAPGPYQAHRNSRIHTQKEATNMLLGHEWRLQGHEWR